MDKAFACPKCGAQIILDKDAEDRCCFCSSVLCEKDQLETVDWGFYTRGWTDPTRLTAYKCLECKKEQYVQDPSIQPNHCLYCGSDDILPSEIHDCRIPLPIRKVPFTYTREDAVSELRKSLKGPKLVFGSGKDFEKAITPVYVPCFVFNYRVYANAVLSVVPIVTAPRDLATKGLSLLFNSEDLSYEISSSAVQPYPKNFATEMVWQNIPVCASASIADEVFEQISPFSIKRGEDDPALSSMKDACVLLPDREFEDIEKTLLREVKDWVKECVLVSHIDHFKVSSYVDNSEYERGLGQLVYLPVWQLKYRKKNSCYTWYMNAVSGEPSELKVISLDETRVTEEETDPLKLNSKKRIKTFKAGDVTKDEYDLNYRSYMVDNFAVTIAMDTEYEAASADKAVMHLERSQKHREVKLEVPQQLGAYEAELDEQVAEAKKNSIPSAPVPLPEEHSPLYMMKEAARTRSLGRGQRLPEKQVDRKIGNEAQFERQDTQESLAVEFGLSDLPEYDPSGPNPFQKNQ